MDKKISHGGLWHLQVCGRYWLHFFRESLGRKQRLEHKQGARWGNIQVSNNMSCLLLCRIKENAVNCLSLKEKKWDRLSYAVQALNLWPAYLHHPSNWIRSVFPHEVESWRKNIQERTFTKEWGRAQVFVWAYIQAYLSVEKKNFLRKWLSRGSLVSTSVRLCISGSLREPSSSFKLNCLTLSLPSWGDKRPWRHWLGSVSCQLGHLSSCADHPPPPAL